MHPQVQLITLLKQQVPVEELGLCGEGGGGLWGLGGLGGLSAPEEVEGDPVLPTA